MSDVPLFWTKEYAKLHGEDHCLLTTKVGLIPLSRAGSNILRSPGRATFGGIWGVPDLDFRVTSELVRDLRNYDSGFTEIKISFPPAYFHPEVFESQVRYFDTNCDRKITETNFHINVSNRLLISKGNRKKLRQFSEQGGQVIRLDSYEWRDLYDLLYANRARRGVNLSMSWDVFEKGLRELPDKFEAWGAKLNDELIGGALTVEIDEKTLYVLFWGDSLLGREISVVASICERLVGHCISRNYNVLDLGISSVDGVLDQNLARFKKNLGAVISSKPIFTLSIP